MAIYVRIVRLPGIHHDSNAVLFIGSDSTILVDTGTTWYQMLQVERIIGHVPDKNMQRILLTSRRYPFAGASSYISKEMGNIPIHIHPSAISVMETGDFYSTWANRYDSDMPSTECLSVQQGEIFELGDGSLTAISLPGHCTDGMGYFEADRGVLVPGAVIPRADNPSRWDLPGGNLAELIESLKVIHELAPSNIVPSRGPSIKGEEHIDQIINRHLEFFESCVDNGGDPPKSWPRPARTSYFLVPDVPWPLLEKESSDNK